MNMFGMNQGMNNGMPNVQQAILQQAASGQANGPKMGGNPGETFGFDPVNPFGSTPTGPQGPQGYTTGPVVAPMEPTAGAPGMNPPSLQPRIPTTQPQIPYATQVPAFDPSSAMSWLGRKSGMPAPGQPMGSRPMASPYSVNPRMMY